MYASYMLGFEKKSLKPKVLDFVLLLKKVNKGRHSQRGK